MSCAYVTLALGNGGGFVSISPGLKSPAARFRSSAPKHRDVSQQSLLDLPHHLRIRLDLQLLQRFSHHSLRDFRFCCLDLLHCPRLAA